MPFSVRTTPIRAAGEWLLGRASATRKFSVLAIAGACLIVTGLALSPWMPLIKKIWTSTFALFSGGVALLIFSLLYLLLDIKQASGIAYLLITHDISVARAFSDRVAVMMRGEIVETGPAIPVLTNPVHEYTRRLLAAVPPLPARSTPAAPKLPG